MLVKCEACGSEVSGAAISCPKCGHPIAGVQPSKEDGPKRSMPIFMIVAAALLLLSFGVPRILLTIPVAVVVVSSIISIFRKERPRAVPYLIAAAAIGLFALNAAELQSITSGTTSSNANLDAAQVTDWNWNPDPTFGTHGTVHWNVSVKNVSAKPISEARVEFTTYDKANKIIATTFTFVPAIPPGQVRSESSYADYYGTEAKANVQLTEVRFADQ